MKKEKIIDIGSYISILIYLFVALVKIFVALLASSAALYADGLNSASDVISTLIILIGNKLSRLPKDSNHQYGHHKIAQIATIVASFVMGSIGVQAMIEGINKFRQPHLVAPDMLAAYTAIISAVLIFISSYINWRIHKKIKAFSVKTIAKHNFSDGLTSFGTFITIIIAQFNIPWIDPLISLVIAIIILKTAWDIFYEASFSLIDGFDQKKLLEYQQFILKFPCVQDIKEIKGRKLGDENALELTITVDGSITVQAAHDITDQIEMKMFERYQIETIIIHVEPNLPAQK